MVSEDKFETKLVTNGSTKINMKSKRRIMDNKTIQNFKNKFKNSAKFDGKMKVGSSCLTRFLKKIF